MYAKGGDMLHKCTSNLPKLFLDACIEYKVKMSFQDLTLKAVN